MTLDRDAHIDFLDKVRQIPDIANITEIKRIALLYEGQHTTVTLPFHELA